MIVLLLAKGAERVGRLRTRLPEHIRVLEFEGERWAPVEVVAVATANRNDPELGLATLAPVDEEGNARPTIVGLWVAEPARRQGIATALLCALADESLERYGTPARVEPGPAGLAVALAALRRGAKLVVVEARWPRERR